MYNLNNNNSQFGAILKLPEGDDSINFFRQLSEGQAILFPLLLELANFRSWKKKQLLAE